MGDVLDDDTAYAMHIERWKAETGAPETFVRCPVCNRWSAHGGSRESQLRRAEEHLALCDFDVMDDAEAS